MENSEGDVLAVVDLEREIRVGAVVMTAATGNGSRELARGWQTRSAKGSTAKHGWKFWKDSCDDRLDSNVNIVSFWCCSVIKRGAKEGRIDHVTLRDCFNNQIVICLVNE